MVVERVRFEHRREIYCIYTVVDGGLDTQTKKHTFLDKRAFFWKPLNGRTVNRKRVSLEEKASV